jgi:hypothetical protein
MLNVDIHHVRQGAIGRFLTAASGGGIIFLFASWTEDSRQEPGMGLGQKALGL